MKREIQEFLLGLFGRGKRLKSLKSAEEPNLKINLVDYLIRFAKSGVGVETVPYGLALEHRNGPQRGLRFSTIYYDAPHNLVLTHQDESGKLRAIASIGFEVDLVRLAVVILQIQGVKGAAKFLKPLRWEKMLIAIATDTSRQFGAKRVEIIQAEQSRWYRRSPIDEEERSRNALMHLHYDVTARRSGFILDQAVGRYALNVNS